MKNPELQRMFEEAIENITSRQCWIDCKCLNCLADSILIKKITALRDEVARLEKERGEIFKRLTMYISGTYADETIIEDLLMMLRGANDSTTD